MKTVYTKADLAKRYQVTLQTIHNWKEVGMIGHLKVGRLIRFTEEHVRRFEQSHNIKPAF